jgi:hypothetical protein
MWQTLISLSLALSPVALRKVPPRRRPAFCRPLVEALEDRSLPSAYVVTTTADSGPGSLRDAITQTNADTSHTLYPSPSNPNVDEIDFTITAASNAAGYPAGQAMGYNATTGVATISPLSLLPTITSSVVINGFSQPHSRKNDLPLTGSTAGDNAVRLITLDGTNLSSGSYDLGTYDTAAEAKAALDDASAAARGLEIAAGNSAISGLLMQDFSASAFAFFPGGVLPGAIGTGIHLMSNGNSVSGNYVTNTDTAVMVDNVPNNTIGGTTPEARNVFGAKLIGVVIRGAGATSNQVQGNYLGTDGNQLLNGARGIQVKDASNNLIGGTTAGAGNVITTTAGSDGINIRADPGAPASGNLVQGNYIGLNAAGTAILTVDVGAGIAIRNGAMNNIIGYVTPIGGAAPSGRNVIGGYGIGIWIAGLLIPGASGNVVEGNYIGTKADGSAALDPNAHSSGSGYGILSGNGGTLISGNLISGNNVAVALAGPPCQVQGNWIGTDSTGAQPIPNGVGVKLFTGNHLIGGTAPGTGNIIAFNDGPGVEVAPGANIATAITIEGNSIYANQDINGHTGQAIDYLGQDGDSLTTLPELNWPGGPFTGTDSSYLSNLTLTQTGSTLYYSGTLYGLPNMRYLVTLAANSSDGTYWGSDYLYLTTDSSGQLAFANISFPAPWGTSNTPGTPSASTSVAHSLNNYEQNYPVLTAAESGSSLLVSGTLNGQASTTFTVDVYANPTADPSGYGQGQYYLGATTVTTDASANVSFAADFSAASLPNGVVPAGWYISATATDQPNATLGTAGGNTSQFSLDVQATASNALQPALTPGGTVTIQATTADQAHAILAAAKALDPATTPSSTIVLDLGGQTIQDTVMNIPPQVTLTIVNGTFIGGSPALVVQSGQVIVLTSTFSNATDAPTILVSGGSLKLRNDLIQESTGFNDAAVSITGGTVDLGTASDPGGNTLDVNGTGEFVHNVTSNSVSAVGDNFQLNGVAQAAPTLSFTALTSSAAPSLGGQAVTFTATVRANGSGMPSGSVDFFDTTTNTDLGSVTLSGGKAALTTSALGIGGHIIFASYSGDAGFLPSLDAVTQTVVKNIGILLLDPTGQSLTVSGNAVLNVTNNGVIAVNSSNTAAATASGNASVRASEIDIAGGLTGTKGFHGTTLTGTAPVSDPLATLAAPPQPSTQFTAVNYSGTLQPGTYVGGITVSAGNSVTLQSGIYYLTGGGLTVSGNATVTGTAVMFYITGLPGSNPTAVSISGNATVTLTPPTSGTYQGVVLFEDRTSSGAITVTGNGALNTTGTEYAPAAKVTLAGNEDTDNPAHTSLGSQWIVADLTLSGNATFVITADANNRVVNPNAFMVAGGPVHPAAPIPALTLAEADAAVASALELWAAAGLDAGTLQDLSRTTVTIAPLPAPYLGLAAPGAIYLDPTAEGYGWFPATSATAAPPSDRIDLLTVVTHELGHLFGLMDGNGTALMASTLGAGVRILPDAGALLAPHTTLAPFPVTASRTDASAQQPGLESAPFAANPRADAGDGAILIGESTSSGGNDVVPTVVMAERTSSLDFVSRVPAPGSWSGDRAPMVGKALTVSGARSVGESGNARAADGLALPLSGAQGPALLAAPGVESGPHGAGILSSTGTRDTGGQDLRAGGSQILVGGEGEDVVIGGKGEGVLIGGMGASAFGDPDAPLMAITIEGTSGHDCATPVTNLTDTGTGLLSRLQGSYFRPDSGSGQTVFNDDCTNTPTSSADADWFIFGTADQATDLFAGDEAVICGD